MRVAKVTQKNMEEPKQRTSTEDFLLANKTKPKLPAVAGGEGDDDVVLLEDQLSMGISSLLPPSRSASPASAKVAAVTVPVRPTPPKRSTVAVAPAAGSAAPPSKRSRTCPAVVEAEASAQEDLKAGAPSARHSEADPKGYYKLLQILPTATMKEIKTAYYRSALIAHPDKGGSDEAFKHVMEAYETLSDPAERAKYDGRMIESITEDGSVAHSTDNENVVDEAKRLLASLIVSPRADWPKLFKRSTLPELEKLASLQQEALTWRASASGKKSLVRVDGERLDSSERNATENVLTKGIKRDGAGYTVKVGWRLFYIKTAYPVQSLENAVRIHMALIQTKNAARQRYRQFCEWMEASGCPISNEDDDCPPLLKEELFDLLLEEPFVPLQFSSDLERRHRRIMSPFTPSLHKALLFRSGIFRVLRKDRGPFEDLIGPVKKIKAVMESQAIEDREKQASLQGDLIAAVSSEIDDRKTKSISSQPLSQSSIPLRLKDAAAASAEAAETALAVHELVEQQGTALAALTNTADSSHAVVTSLQLQLDTRVNGLGQDLRADLEQLRQEVRVLAQRPQLEAREKELQDLILQQDRDLHEKDKRLQAAERSRDALLQQAAASGTSGDSVRAGCVTVPATPFAMSSSTTRRAAAERERQQLRPLASGGLRQSALDSAFRLASSAGVGKKK